jgi:hypothetical protein
MKTLRKNKEKKTVKGFRILKTKELLQTKGGDTAPITQKDIEIH